MVPDPAKEPLTAGSAVKPTSCSSLTEVRTPLPMNFDGFTLFHVTSPLTLLVFDHKGPPAQDWTGSPLGSLILIGLKLIADGELFRPPHEPLPTKSIDVKFILLGAAFGASGLKLTRPCGAV
jgi:hypothetical protein